jgi:chromosome segregation ATPase
MPDDFSNRPEPNYFKAAFLWQYNLIAMAGAAAFSFVSGSPLPLILGAGVELMYMASIPNWPRFQRLVRSRQFAEQQREHEQRMRSMRDRMPFEAIERFRGLELVAADIRKNIDRLSPTSQVMLEQLEQQLQGLLNGFIRLNNSLAQHREYLQTTDPAAIRKELDQLRRSLDKMPEKVREINRKRIDILEKRLERNGRISENQQVIFAQSKAIEDVLHLLRDQSVTMSDPHQISDRLEVLVKDVETTEDTIREMEQVFQISPEAESILDSGSNSGSNDRLRS